MVKFNKLILLIIIFTLSKSISGENNRDSLLSLLSVSDEKLKSEIYSKLSQIYIDSSGDASLEFANEAITYALNNNQISELIDGYINLGCAQLRKNNYRLSLVSFMKADSIMLKNQITDHSQFHTVYNNIAIIYKSLDEYDIALEYYSKALIYANMMKSDKALFQTLLNIGNIYVNKNELDSALVFYDEAYSKSQQLHDSYYDNALLFNNYGYIFEHKQELENALKYYQMAFDNFEKIDNNYGMAIVLNNIAQIMILKKEFSTAEIFINKADSLHKINNYSEPRKNLYHTSYLLYLESKDYSRAIKYLNMYYQLKDSIYNNELNVTINELKTKYAVDKLKIESENKDFEISQQNKINKFLIIVIIVISALSLLLFITIKKKNRINKLLKSANKKLIEKDELIKQNLNYARKIQIACMNQDINEIAYDNFIIDIPKSIVGGDFYVLRNIKNKTFIALADSTGHGISGGFLSVLGIQFLNYGISHFSDLTHIMDYLNNRFYNYITKNESLSNESLCISVICIENGSVLFTGSRHKIWKYNSKENIIEEYKTDTYTIGTKENFKFKVDKFSFYLNDYIYLSSDGFPDQFGSGNKGKLKYEEFRKILLSASLLNITNSKLYIENKLSSWKQDEEQTDDILVIGIKK